MLARFVHDLLAPLLESLGGPEALSSQLAVVDRLIAVLRAEIEDSPVLPDDAPSPPARQLLSLAGPARSALAAPEAPERPGIPLSVSHLLVNGPRDRGIVSELVRELASADRVALLVSFLKWSGWRLLREPVQQFLSRRPGALQVLTTTYLGATERRVLDDLVRLGAEVRISYDTRRTRLHAKAWLFFRQTGYSTAFVGSSNLSSAAMVDGLEWNVRLSQVETPHVLHQVQSAFNQYWEEGEFEPYAPARDASRVDRALDREQKSPSEGLALHLDVRPYPFQQDILDRLAAERAGGHARNLVVAATGTGKTVVAALDYRELRRQHGPLSLLFVAHRREILDQSLATFRAVLRDNSFGERLYGGRQPVRGLHVFASIQSLSAERIAGLAPDAYEVVIVDEFHHAAAPTYDRLLEQLQPRFLLGLTATPDRADGGSILHHFDDRIAAELRLWHALDQQLLCPFQYFAVTDDSDLRHAGWQSGRYRTADLENIFSGDHARARKILRAVADTVRDPHTMRALGFCVSIRHAELMANEFTTAGVPAAALTAYSSEDERSAILQRLRTRQLNIVFTVDIFNEGVDIPEVDTVLFLRPTESATVFLQQLGRGLRLADDKECLTAIDFVGHMHVRFRFDRRFRAILGGTRQQILREAEHGFPRLPPGCAIHLEREAQQRIIANIKHTLGAGWSALAEDLRSLQGPVTLARFLAAADVDLTELYSGGDKGWTRLRRAAGHRLPPTTGTERALSRAIGRVIHVNDPARLQLWLETLEHGQIPIAFDLNKPQHRLLLMLSSMLDPARRPLAEQPRVLSRLLDHPHLADELRQLLALLYDTATRPVRRLELGLAAPLQLHADYQLIEIMAAFASISSDSGKLIRPQAGVYWHQRVQCDLFFVTLEKSERDYSPTTMYRDFPISPTLFHWQSQSNTREDSPTGRRYQQHASKGSHVLFFVRRRNRDDRGETAPYTFLGPATYQHHKGDRPMSITWRLQHAMPAVLFEEMKVAAG